MQAIALLQTEIVCIFICAFSVAPIAIVENFIALGIIADFDNYIFESFVTPIKEIYELSEDDMDEGGVLCINHTTSIHCSPDEKSKVKDSFG